MSRVDVSETAISPGEQIEVSVSNLGGITECEVTIPRGVTVLEGENATNRTSLLRSIAAALGADETAISLKTDESHGRVSLTIGEETYTREYEATDSTVRVDGDPLVTDPTVVDTFAVMVADNPARQAVERDGNLRDVLMRPVDIDDLHREIDDLVAERETVRDDLDQVKRERSRLPTLRERRDDIEADLETLTTDIEDLEASLPAEEADDIETQHAESLLEELKDTQRKLADTEDKLRHHREKIEALQTTYTDLGDELETLTVPDDELEELSDRLDALKAQKRTLETQIADLEALLEINTDLVQSETTFLEGDPTDDGTATDVTAKLDPSSETLRCWTCGSVVERSAIESRIGALQDVVAEKRTEREEIRDDIKTVNSEQQELKRRKLERTQLQNRRQEVEREIKYRNEQIDELSEQADRYRSEIQDLQQKVEETEELRENDLVEGYQRLSELQYERGKLEEERDAVTRQIADLEALAERRDELQRRETEIGEQLEQLRDRIETLEQSAVDAFNNRVNDLIDVLGYENIERVWLERLVSGAGDDAEMELHIVRKNEAGQVYEDTIDTLSESERKLIGLVVGLTGYLIHDVSTTVPLMLLDSLEAIDAERINSLLSYFSDHVPFLVVALLPEDAATVSGEYTVLAADDFCTPASS